MGYEVRGTAAEQIAALEADVAQLKSQVANIRQCGCTEDAMKQLIQDTITENKVQLNKWAVDEVVVQLGKENSVLNDAIAKSEAVNHCLVEIYGENGDAGMKKQVNDLERDFNREKAGWTEKSQELTDELERVSIEANEAHNLADENFDRLQQHGATINSLKDTYDKLNNVTIPYLTNDLEMAKNDIISIADEVAKTRSITTTTPPTADGTGLPAFVVLDTKPETEYQNYVYIYPRN